MKDKTKALEIAMSFIDSEKPTLDRCVESAMKMAEWKNKQTIEWLAKNAWKYVREPEEVKTDNLIEDFKKATEE